MALSLLTICVCLRPPLPSSVCAGATTMIYTAYGGLYISILTDQVQGGCLSWQGWLCCHFASCHCCCIAPRTASPCTNMG